MATSGEADKQPKRKASMLGIGLPSTMRFGLARLVSTSSSLTHLDPNPARYSAGSSVNVEANPDQLGRSRYALSLSAGSSLRPASTALGSSGGSRISSFSAVSIRWDDRALEILREEPCQVKLLALPH